MFLRIYLGAVTVRYIDRNIYGCRPEIKIRYMDVNCALYLLQLSSAQKWKNRHLQQCTLLRKHCDRKSRQNRNLIWKPFSLLIRGPNGFKSWKKSQDTLPVQGQFYKIFFYQKTKTPPGSNMNRQKKLCEFFLFQKDIHKKRVCTKSTITLTRCQRIIVRTASAESTKTQCSKARANPLVNIYAKQSRDTVLLIL